MITINGKGIYVDTEHFVLHVGEEPICIDFGSGKQVDDMIVSTPDGPVLMKWDSDIWDDEACLLVNGDVKEIGSVHCTKILLKTGVPGKTITVYLTVQRN